jgi:AcrR family transcriptional regulator
VVAVVPVPGEPSYDPRVSVKDRILRATAELLVDSGGDVSTRAICERAGVGAPALYRNFEDKDALIAAVVADAFEQYLGGKRHAVPDDDPLVDLREGWDSHTRWALANPAYYRLIFGSGRDTSPPATEAIRLLRLVLDRCAERGLLTVSAELAAEMIMAANVGTALMLVQFPTLFRSESLSERLRDTVHAAVLRADDPSGGSSHLSGSAATLKAHVDAGRLAGFSPGETTLLGEWLGRLADEGR